MYVLTATIIFVLVVSIDLFAIGFSYGTGRVKIPFKRVLVINLLGKLVIGSSLIAGYFLGQVIPNRIGIWIGFSILTALGIYKILQSILGRYKAPTRAEMSWLGSVILGLVLSLDGAAMAFGTTVANMPIYFAGIVIGTLLITDQIVLSAANKLGLLISTRKQKPTDTDTPPAANWDWVAGAILIIVATAKVLIEMFI